MTKWANVVWVKEAAVTYRRGGEVSRVDGVMRSNTMLALPLPSPPQIWNDYKLKWNPSDYDGAEFMRVPAQKIWKPDIVLYNK